MHMYTICGDYSRQGCNLHKASECRVLSGEYPLLMKHRKLKKEEAN